MIFIISFEKKLDDSANVQELWLTSSTRHHPHLGHQATFSALHHQVFHDTTGGSCWSHVGQRMKTPVSYVYGFAHVSLGCVLEKFVYADCVYVYTSMIEDTVSNGKHVQNSTHSCIFIELVWNCTTTMIPGQQISGGLVGMAASSLDSIPISRFIIPKPSTTQLQYRLVQKLHAPPPKKKGTNVLQKGTKKLKGNASSNPTINFQGTCSFASPQSSHMGRKLGSSHVTEGKEKPAVDARREGQPKTI